MAYTIVLGKQGKRLYTIGPERRVYTIEASDPEKEKMEGFHGGGVFFLRCPKTPLFGEPMVCSPDFRGFRHFRGFRDLSDLR